MKSAIGISAAAGVALALVAFPGVLPARADAVADFYKGKIFEIHVGFAAGGGYDSYARFLARHIGRHIPGTPKVIVRNRPGGATLTLANALYAKGPMDGTVMGMVARGVPTHALLGGNGTHFDPGRFHWVGSMNNEVSTCVVAARAGIDDFAGLLEKEVAVGGQGPGSDADQFTNFIDNLMGARMKLITGYPGTAVTVLALDRGEVDGICGWSWTSVKHMRGEAVAAGRLRILVQMALRKHPELPDVPLITDLARTASQRRQMELLFSRQTIGRPFLLPPGVPKARVEAVRAAFAAAMRDPAFVAEAGKAGMETHWVSGAEVQKLIERVLATPTEIVAAARRNIFPKGPVARASLSFIDAIGRIDAVKRGGRRLVMSIGGKTVDAAVSGGRTEITVKGKPANRGAIKAGMRCRISYLGPGTTARSLDCQ